MKKTPKRAPSTDHDDTSTSPPTFEVGLEELDRLVQGLERGELSLDESVAAFERGTHLLKALHAKLRLAETRVKELIDEEGEGFLERDLHPGARDDE